MVMTIEPNAVGGLRIRQTMQRPVVYLDHWAVRLFADQGALAERFISALQAARATWLFTQINLTEFCAMHDVESARRVEALISDAYPHFYVLDTVGETDFFQARARGAQRDPGAPDEHWILVELAERARITGGVLNTHRFISDAITHGERLLPLFEHLKREVAQAIASRRVQLFAARDRKKVRPRPGMNLREIFIDELLMDPTESGGRDFRDNDTTDFLHAVPSCLLCDFVLLDSAWCHKVAVAKRRIGKAGIKGRIAECFSPRQVPDFLTQLEAQRNEHPPLADQ